MPWKPGVSPWNALSEEGLAAWTQSFPGFQATEPEETEGPPAGGSTLYAEFLSAYVMHNTFAHPSLAYHFGVLANPYAAVHLANNILTNFSVGIHRQGGGTGSVSTTYTLFWNNLHDYTTSAVTSSHEVHGDPVFAGGSDYRLTAASAAIDAGRDVGVAYDFYGASRPWGDGFDIGAEEYPHRARVFLPLVAK